jgi:hypothetical protein
VSVEWHSGILLAGTTKEDDHPAMNANSAVHGREKIAITVRTESPLVLSRDRDEIFHREFPCQQDVAIRQR